jgi:uncharacterized protein with ParB-like and HNH nuclease domain
MKSHVQTVLGLFENKRRYIVPLFQRQYAWSLERQWRPLWEDIERKVVERLRWGEKVEDAQGEERVQVQASPPAEHFLGAIVLDLYRTFGNEVPAQTIIDGQQRLTTSQILLAALRDAAEKHGVSDYLAELKRYTTNEGIMANPAVEKYKVWPTQFDQPHFRVLVEAGDLASVAQQYPALEGAKHDGLPLIVRAYAFFWRALEDFLSREQLSQRLQTQPSSYERIKALFEVFQHELQIVSIELEGQDDPQVIFETLNARGEPLLPSDLLRNHLFWRASRANEDVENLYETYWKQFDSEFWKKQERQGRLTRPRVDLFFFDLLQLKTAAEVNVARLYHEYKEWSEKTARYPSVRDELQEIHRYSLHLDKLLRPANDTAIGRFSQILQIFDVKTVFPLVLKLLADGDLDESELESILMDFESYLVRRQVCGLTSQGFNRLFVTWIAKLDEDGRTLSQRSLREVMLSEDANSAIWPDDAQLQQAWLNDPVYKRLRTNGRLEYILRRLELKLRTAKHEEVSIRSGLTIEHVLPQDWIEHWPLPNGQPGVTTGQRLDHPSPESDERDRMLQTMGNLTLLTGPANSSLQNASFDVKVKQIEDYSLLALNSYFKKRVDEGKGWDEAAIDERGRVLFKMATELWSYPGPSREASK